MKIAFIGHKRIPSREGGVEVVVEELATRMVTLGYDVTCYNRSGKHALDKKNKIENLKKYKGVKIKKVFTIDKKGLSAMTSSFFGTIKILFSGAEIVHYHAEGSCVMIPIIKFLCNKKIIVTIHGLDWQRAKWKDGFASKYIKLGERMAVKYADEIIVLSEHIKKYFKDNYNRNTHFIPNGVNKPIKKNANVIKSKYNLEKDSYVLFLGRLVPEKGIHYLINAFCQINTDKKLVIAGGASDTNSYYLKLIELSKNNKNIIFTGFVQGELLDELYSNAYIYVLPSDLEGMPISLLEAMSYGNCCLTSNIPECTTVIGNKGFTFTKGNVIDLKNKLEFLLNNKYEVTEIRKKSEKYILDNYNWDNVVNSTLEIYMK